MDNVNNNIDSSATETPEIETTEPAPAETKQEQAGNTKKETKKDSTKSTSTREQDKYYIYWQNADKNGKWQLIQDTPEKREQAIKQGAAYFTTMSFKNSKGYDPKKPEPIRTGNLYFDFDDKEQPENALKDMLKLVNHLQEIYSLDSYDWRFWLSGGKGFHAMIPAHVLGETAVNGLTNLHLIYKKMVLHWKTTLELNSLDMSIYSGGKGRMFRIENIKRPDNGKHKVQLTFDELTLPYSELIELSAEPRTVDDIDIDCLKADSEIQENAQLKALFNNTYKEIIEINNIDIRVSRTPFTAIQKQFLTDNIPACISHILISKPAKSDHVNFNKLLMVIVPYFQQAGKTLEESLNISADFLNNYQHSDTYSTAQKRISAFKSMWLYTQQNANYKFNCNFIKGLHLPKDKDIENGFDCSACEANKPFESKTLPFCFWQEELNSKEEPALKIYERELYLFLESVGYRNTVIYEVPVMIRITDNIIEEVNISDIRQALMKEFLPQLPDQISDNFYKVQLEEMLLRRIADYISVEKLQTIQKEKILLHTDTENQTVFFFKNGIVECTATGATLKPYKSLNGVYVWRKSIIDHDIKLNDNINSDYQKFLTNVCTQPETNTFETERYNALLTVHGYMLNRYNNLSYPVSVILSDGNLADDSNGRTGKGIIAAAIKKLRQQAYIDAKTTDFKSQFAFQNVERTTEIILIDDAKKTFNFEEFFGKTTYGYKVECKYQQAFQFTPENNPKTLITTNFAIKGTGASFEGRKFEFELLPYYTVDRTPEQDFGTLFNWNSEQWNSFYNFMFETCKTFHSAENRILKYDSDTLELKKLQVEIGQDFIDFADTIARNEFIKSKTLIEHYKNTLSERGKAFVSDSTFGKHLRKYCKNKGIELETQLTGGKHDRQQSYYLKDSGYTAPDTDGYTPQPKYNHEPPAPVYINAKLDFNTAEKQTIQKQEIQEPEYSVEPDAEPPQLQCKAFINNECYAYSIFEHHSGKPTPCNIKTCKHKDRNNIFELIELAN